jgi:integrase
VKLTKSTIGRLVAPDPTGAQSFYWDDEVKGFGVCCSGTTSSKSFVAQAKARGKRTRRVSFSPVATWFAAGKTVEEARVEAARVIVDIRAGKDPRGRGRFTLQEALDAYLEHRPNLAERSRVFYRDHVERWFKAWLNRPLADITDEMIEKRFHQITADVARRRKEQPEHFVSEPGGATANGALRGLRAVWNFAEERDDALPPWPTRKLRGQWNHVGRRTRHVKSDDLEAFYEAVNATDDDGEFLMGRTARDYVLLVLFTGLRVQEAASLRWEYVDFAAGVFRIPLQRTKSKRPLDLPMSDLVRPLLAARRELGVDPSGFVFPARSESGHLEDCRRQLTSACDRAEIRHVSVHDVRRTFISVARGVLSRDDVKPLVNHSIDVSDVTEGYVSEFDLLSRVQKVAEPLRELCGIQRKRRKRKRRRRAA